MKQGLDEGEERMRVLFILGSGHCGSTLLDLLLDGHSRIVGVGEMSGARPDDRCTCGRAASACKFWRDALGQEPWVRHEPYRGKTAFLLGHGDYRVPSSHHIIDVDNYRQQVETAYRRILQSTGADLLVDSSKSPERAEILSQSKAVDPVVLHLVRDGRAVTWSFVRKYEPRLPYLLRWAGTNMKVEVLRKRWQTRVRFLFMRYEDLVDDPQSQLTRLCEAVGLEYEPGMLAFRSSEHHQIGGNRIRLASDADIHADNAWRTDMPKWQRAFFDLCFGLLNFCYQRRSSL
jgi:Sulfotransferase family